MSYNKRLLKTTRIDKVTNKKVLTLLGAKWSNWQHLTKRKRRDMLVGHILRHKVLFSIVMDGSASDKNGVGIPRLEYRKKIQRDRL